MKLLLNIGVPLLFVAAGFLTAILCSWRFVYYMDSPLRRLRQLHAGVAGAAYLLIASLTGLAVHFFGQSIYIVIIGAAALVGATIGFELTKPSIRRWA